MTDAAQRRRSWARIAVFTALTFGFSSIFYVLILNVGQLRGSEMLYVTGLMWCPALAAVLTQRLFGESIAGFGWGWGQTRFQVWAFLIPVAYALPVYLIVWGSGLAPFNLEGFAAAKAEAFGWQGAPDVIVLVAYVLLAGTAGVILFMARTLGEEIGWRGFLVPELSKVTGFTGTALISGILWAAWHYPILIFGDYNMGTPAWFGLTCFTLMVIGVSFVLTWLRLSSGTLWTAALLHASHNRFVQTVFTPLTGESEIAPYVIDEFGAGLAVTALIAGALAWRYARRQPAA
jgi:uncharacterized protein